MVDDIDYRHRPRLDSFTASYPREYIGTHGAAADANGYPLLWMATIGELYRPKTV